MLSQSEVLPDLWKSRSFLSLVLLRMLSKIEDYQNRISKLQPKRSARLQKKSLTKSNCYDPKRQAILVVFDHEEEQN